MKNNSFSVFFRAAQDRLDINSNKRLEYLANQLNLLASNENIQNKKRLELALLMSLVKYSEEEIEVILTDKSLHVPDNEVELVRQIYKGMSTNKEVFLPQKENQILSDIFILEQIGAAKLVHVFESLETSDCMQLVKEVDKACLEAHEFFEDLQCQTSKEIAIKRLQAMDQYRLTLKREME
ncbi:hypothetical protein ANAEL_00340 [Anaerolineales bacterium]|nr:hypothetical protein ANAEL_00340 [Anaerolineales bacterium]